LDHSTIISINFFSEPHINLLYSSSLNEFVNILSIGDDLMANTYVKDNNESVPSIKIIDNVIIKNPSIFFIFDKKSVIKNKEAAKIKLTINAAIKSFLFNVGNLILGSMIILTTPPPNTIMFLLNKLNDIVYIICEQKKVKITIF